MIAAAEQKKTCKGRIAGAESLSTMPAQMKANARDHRSEANGQTDEDSDDGAILVASTTGVKERHIPVRRTRCPKVEQCGVLCHRAVIAQIPKSCSPR